MRLRILRSLSLRVIVVTLVMLGAGFVFLAQPAAAQDASSEVVIGLQQDMVNMNSWDPGTNSVWKFYQIYQLNFEGLFTSDPDANLVPAIADPARGGTAPGYTLAADGKTVDVFLRPYVTFTDNQPLTADDVIFTYQTLLWGTPSTAIGEALWDDVPRFAHWTGGTNRSHIGVEKVSADVVRFHLKQPPYALFFLSSLQWGIIPKHIWATHINPAPQLNYSNPLATITDSADRSIDFGFGSAATEIAATIGTGPWKLISWARNQGSRVAVSDTYWGKGRTDAGFTWSGVRYNFYPDHVRSIRFVQYTSLDVISLALQKGDVDTLVWPLLPGFLSQVRFNPVISVEKVTDIGMFYLSFNLRRKPWNDLNLRKAISMAIDKDYIVNTLMGGFGIKGTIPWSVHNPTWVNQSAQPPTFDLAGARALLDSVNIKDINGDGFREYSDGSAIKAAILTPPKDYDPIRADSGIMISNNLKKIGLNIDSAPTSFNTIVDKAFGAQRGDFDLYILGFSLSSNPEADLKDFFHSTSDVVINPAGSNSAGYKNPKVDSLINQMLVTLDDQARAALVRDVEGIVTNDIPWNILYYRKNLNAYRNDRWVGWVNTPPQLYSSISLSKIGRPGAVVLPPPSGDLQVALTVPERSIGGRTVPVDVFVTQNFAPVPGVTVWVNSSFGLETRTDQGTTDTSGRVSFSWKAPVIQGQLTFKATAAKGGSTGSTSKILQITVGPPAPIATLTVSTTKPVLGVGGTTSVVAKFIDSNGVGVPGATVRVDRTLVLGNITPGSGVTDATGSVAFTYKAPASTSLFPNQHLTDFLKFNTTMGETVATDTQSASMIIFVENDNAPDWLIADIQATDLVLNRILLADSTTIGVKVTNFTGVAKSGVVVEAILPASESGIANVTVTPVTNTTDAAGLATFTVAKTASAVNGNVPIRFRVKGTAYQASDVAGVLVTDGVAPGYAALLDISDRSITSVPAQTTTVTATVWDQTGLPATNAGVILYIPPGDLGLAAQFPWAFDYTTGRYLDQGLDLSQPWDGAGSFGPTFQNSTGQGAAWGVDNAVSDAELLGLSSVDSCDPTTYPAGFDGVYHVNATGVMTQTIQPAQHKGDSAVQVRAYIGSILPGSRLHLDLNSCDPASQFFGWTIAVKNASFVIDSGLVVQRARVFALGSVSVGTGGQIFRSDARTQTVTANFYLRDGAPAPNVKVFLTRGFGTGARNVRGRYGGTILTDATGKLTWNVTVPLLSLSQPHYFGFLAADERYAYGGREQMFSGLFGELCAAGIIGPSGAPPPPSCTREQGKDYYLNQFQFAVIAKIPLEFVRGYLFVPSTVAFASVSVDKTLVGAGGSATATVTVKTGTDTPIPNATVWSGAIQTVTDAKGNATIPFSASLGATENLAVVQTTDGQTLRAWYGIVASEPVLTYGAITVTPGAAGQASKISVTVTNALAVAGSATVTLLVRGQAVASQVVAIGASETKTVTFDQIFAAAGDYAIGIGDKTATATIPPAPGPDLTLGIGLLVAGLAVGAVVGIVLSRRKRPPTAVEQPMAEEEMKRSGDEEL